MKATEKVSQETMPWSISSTKAVSVKESRSPKLQDTARTHARTHVHAHTQEEKERERHSLGNLSRRVNGSECEQCVAAIQAQPTGGASEKRAASGDNGRKEAAEGGRGEAERGRKRRDV